MFSLLRKPSAWIPLSMSLVVIVVWVAALVTAGVPARQPDEGTGAHLFQIWLAVELVSLIFFAGKWLPQKPRQAGPILLMQIAAVIAACFPVYYFHL